MVKQNKVIPVLTGEAAVRFEKMARESEQKKGSIPFKDAIDSHNRILEGVLNLHDTINNSINTLIKKLNEQIDDVIIEGLRLKGHIFENKIGLAGFIKSRCWCNDDTDTKKKTYYVDDIPFLVHDYNIKMDMNPINENGCMKFSVNYGSYKYV